MLSTTFSIGQPIIVFGIALLGVIIGSFLNAVIYRLPKQISLCHPRSCCPHCQKTIFFYWNIPILSYLLLKGRCHQCHQSISGQYPLVEVLSLCLSVFAYFLFGLSSKLVYALVFIYFSIPLIFIDLAHFILPDILTLGLLWVGLLANLADIFATLPNAVVGAIAGYLSLWLVIQGYALFTGKIGMGHGDFKLFAALGAWFGWRALPEILLLAAVPGIIIGGLYLKIRKKNKDTPIPFGPFLCVAGVIYLAISDVVALTP